MRSNEKFTQRAETAIEAARSAAGELGHAYIGTEHLLLGILEEEDGLGAHILRRQGLEKEHLRRVIAREAGLGCPGAPGLGLTPNARAALRRTIRREIVDRAAQMLLEGSVRAGDTLEAVCSGEGITLLRV